MIFGFSNILRNSTPYYFVDLPSFQRDFASLKTLDHGTGPAITFTRASNATFFDANGTLQTAANDTPRFDHSGGSSLGLLIEEARTNSIRNSQAGGAVAGVLGSGGVLATHWGSFRPFGAVEVMGNGTENGLAYVEVKVSGTNSTGSGATILISPESFTQVAASSGQSWTASFYVKLQNGSTSGIANLELVLQGRASGNISLTENTKTAISPTSAYQRFVVSRTLNNASTALVSNDIAIFCNDGATLNLTLRIAAPQLEQGAFATSYIPTTTAAATRSADSAVVTPISSFYNQAEGTIIVQSSYAGAGSSATVPNRVSLQFDDNSVNNRHLLHNRHTNGAGGSSTLVGNVTQAQTAIDTVEVPVNTPVFLGMVYKENDIIAAKNGTLSSEDTSALLPTVSRLRVGHTFDGSGPLGHINGHIRKIAYWPKRLTNTLLEQLTT